MWFIFLNISLTDEEQKEMLWRIKEEADCSEQIKESNLQTLPDGPGPPTANLFEGVNS